jgi:hypothetical protein
MMLTRTFYIEPVKVGSQPPIYNFGSFYDHYIYMNIGHGSTFVHNHQHLQFYF